MNGKWIEVTLRVDGEAAEATAELLQRYGYQGVAIEHEGIPPDKLDEDEIPPPKMLAVRAYIPLDDRTDETKSVRTDAASRRMVGPSRTRPVGEAAITSFSASSAATMRCTVERARFTRCAI